MEIAKWEHVFEQKFLEFRMCEKEISKFNLWIKPKFQDEYHQDKNLSKQQEKLKNRK